MSGTAPLPRLALTALSPVATGTAFCRLAGVLWITVVVKASFQLVPGQAARLLAAVELVHEDRTAGPGSSSLVAARETAPHLPNAGVVLTGHACAPDGRAVPSMSVRLGLSRDRPVIDKTIHVFGARAADNPAAIAPFQRMPIVPQRAFGGAGIWENPVGTGGPGSRLLPNFVDPKDPRKVACFGPIAREWAPRRALLCGLDPAVVEGAVWDVPAGFDWRFFQAAPADQQCDRLHGDEWIVLDGMDAELPRVQSRLPQVIAYARRHVTGAGGAVAEQPIELRADTLVIDADRRVASLVWRGRFAAEGATLERTRVLAGVEMPGQTIVWPSLPAKPDGAPRPAETLETQEINLAAILGGVVPFSGERNSALPPGSAAAPSNPGKPMFTGTEVVDLRSLLKKPVPFAAAVATTELPAAGGGPSPLVATLEGLPSVHATELPFTSADPARPPAESLPTTPTQRRAPAYTGTADINLAAVLGSVTPYGTPVERVPLSVVAQAPSAPAPSGPAPAVPVPAVPVPSVPVLAVPAPALHTPPPTPLLPTAVPSLAPTPPIPTPLHEPPAATPAVPSLSVSVPVSAVDLGRKDDQKSPPEPLRAARSAHATASLRKEAQDKLSRKEPFDGGDFEGANLSALDLSGCSLVRCNLRGATLRGANLSGANLAGAILDEADLRGAILETADLGDASLVKANLERAKLARCGAEGASLREANLFGADLRSGRFADASLVDADLREATADRADFTGARLDRVDARGASMRHAKLASAVLAHANLARANLQNADLRGANLHQAIRRMVKLAGADLREIDDAAPPASEHR